MNTTALTNRFEKFGIFVLTFFFSVMAFAQTTTNTPDVCVDVTTTKTTGLKNGLASRCIG